MWKKDGFGTRGKGLTMRLSRRQERMSRRGAIIVAATLMLVPARAVADVSAQGVGDATQAVDGATQAVGDAVGDATQAVDNATQAVGGAVDDATQAVGGAVDDATQAVDDATQDATQAVGDAVDDASQAVGGAVGGASQAVGGAVGGATQAVGGAVGGATQAVGNVADGATQGASGAVGDGGSTGGRVDGAPGGPGSGTPSDRRNDPAAMSRHPAAPRTPWPASHAEVDRVFPTPQGEGVDEQGDPCVGEAGSVCLGLLYGMGGFEDGGAKVLGILVTTGAAVIVLMLICLGLVVTGSTLVMASRRSVARSATS